MESSNIYDDVAQQTAEQVQQAGRNNEGQYQPPLVALNVAELLKREFPPRDNLLTPWLPKQGLVQVYANRGVGKTHFALGVGIAVASGGKFLIWEAERLFFRLLVFSISS
jgi:RecA-family ATPase